eukprot:scaffold71366_cov18-Prasinocladus_malaysianus.AAC.1
MLVAAGDLPPPPFAGYAMLQGHLKKRGSRSKHSKGSSGATVDGHTGASSAHSEPAEDLENTNADPVAEIGTTHQGVSGNLPAQTSVSGRDSDPGKEELPQQADTIKLKEAEESLREGKAEAKMETEVEDNGERTEGEAGRNYKGKGGEGGEEEEDSFVEENDKEEMDEANEAEEVREANFEDVDAVDDQLEGMADEASNSGQGEGTKKVVFTSKEGQGEAEGEDRGGGGDVAEGDGKEAGVAVLEEAHPDEGLEEVAVEDEKSSKAVASME